MRPWKFGKPKTPGFGLSGSFYLTVLSSKPVLPSITDFIEPNGANGAVEGFGAPLSDQKDRVALAKPLERGAYVVATKDRKTVLKMLVMSSAEAGFDSEAYALSSYAESADPELLARIRATWTLMQLRFESHDPDVYPALDFVLAVCQKLAELTEGVVADRISQQYLLPEQVFHYPRLDPKVDARDLVSIQERSRPDGNHIYTLGLQKFDLPEFEIVGVLPEDRTIASKFLIALAQSILLGSLVKSGDRFGSAEVPFEAREGGFDKGLWDGVEILELLPPTLNTPSEALNAWNEQMKGSTL